VTRRKGSSPETRSQWRVTYEETPYEELPWFDPDPAPEVVFAIKSGFFPPAGRVLDIGCGAGSNLLELARNGYDVHGVDLSPKAARVALERAQAAGLAVDAREGDALDLPFGNSTLDALVDIGCFHTIPIDRREDYGREVQRVLRPDGAYLLSWVAREHTGAQGPPHRPSLNEVTQLFERSFLFTRTDYFPGGDRTGPPHYSAYLRHRASPQPPRV